MVRFAGMGVSCPSIGAPSITSRAKLCLTGKVPIGQCRGMTLSEYLNQPGHTATALARAVGVRVSSITRLRDGKRRASLALALRINEATAGKVAPIDLACLPPVLPSSHSEAAS